MTDAVLEIAGLTRSFTQAAVTIDVLRGVDLEVKRGEIVALVGASGAGKSTLLQAVGLLEGGWSGAIRIDGVDCARLNSDQRTALRRDKLGFIYQFHHLLPDFSALENAAMPLLIGGARPADARARAIAALGELGLAQRLDHRPAQLSGGEQQRVAVARALAGDPALVLADEPTGNLDEATADVVLEQFMRLVRAKNASALIATHNAALAQRLDRTVLLHEGRLTEVLRAG